MYAVSFLGALGHIRGVVSDRRAARSMKSNQASWDAIDDVHHAMCDFIDLWMAGLPLSGLSCEPPAHADEYVADAMTETISRVEQSHSDVRTDGNGKSDHSLAADSHGRGDTRHTGEEEFFAADGREVYTVENRIERIDGNQLIPLGETGATAANWYILCDVVADVGSSMAVNCQILSDGHRQQGNKAVAEAWESVATFVRDISTFVDYHVSIARWVHVPGRNVVEQAENSRSLAEYLNKSVRRR